MVLSSAFSSSWRTIFPSPLSEILALRHTIPTFLAGWAPNFLFGALGIYLLVKVAKESPFKPAIWLTEAIDAVQQKWKGLFEDV